jgi:hypothetical protein
MLSLLGASPEHRCLLFLFIVTIMPVPSPCPCRQGSSGKPALCRPSVRWRPAGPVCAANPLPERWGARRFYRGQKRRIDFRHPSELGHALGNRDETIQTSVIPCGTRLLRRPVWPECRHISANNMHALDASLYLAISIIDAVGVRRETVFERTGAGQGTTIRHRRLFQAGSRGTLCGRVPQTCASSRGNRSQI